MSKMQDYMDAAEKVILKTYNRFPMVLERGEGVCLYDMEGKRYLDFGRASPYLPWATQTGNSKMR